MPAGGGLGVFPCGASGRVGHDIQKVTLCVYSLVLREYGSIAWRSSLGIIGC